MTENERLTHLAEDYKRKLEKMQGHVFFIQNEDGLLCRWVPPRPNSVFDGVVT